MNPTLKRKCKKIIAPIRRFGLKNKQFSLISNNCWGGLVYDAFGLPYLSPTIGLIIPSADFVRFCSNLSHYLSVDARLLSEAEIALQPKYVRDASKTYPVGMVDDVVIIFVHYHDGGLAIEKWNRRRQRVNFDNLLLKFSDDFDFKKEDAFSFSQIAGTKIFFTKSKELAESFKPFSFFIPEGEASGVVNSFKILPLKEIKRILNSNKSI